MQEGVVSCYRIAYLVQCLLEFLKSLLAYIKSGCETHLKALHPVTMQNNEVAAQIKGVG